MASRTKTRLKETKKLQAEARFTFGKHLTGVEKVKAENRRLFLSLSEPIAEGDTRLTVVGKRAMRGYLERVGLPAEEAVPQMDAGPDDPVIREIYRAYLNLPNPFERATDERMAL